MARGEDQFAWKMGGSAGTYERSSISGDLHRRCFMDFLKGIAYGETLAQGLRLVLPRPMAHSVGGLILFCLLIPRSRTVSISTPVNNKRHQGRGKRFAHIGMHIAIVITSLRGWALRLGLFHIHGHGRVRFKCVCYCSVHIRYADVPS